jgi:hypothetical protein
MAASFVFLHERLDLRPGIEVILDAVAGRENDPVEVGRRRAEASHVEVGQPRQLAVRERLPVAIDRDQHISPRAEEHTPREDSQSILEPAVDCGIVVAFNQ